jgi:hypothetical protein
MSIFYKQVSYAILFLCLACTSVTSFSRPLDFYHSPDLNLEMSTLETLNRTFQLSLEYGFARFAAGGVEIFIRDYDKENINNNNAPQYGIGGRIELHRNGSFETGLYSAFFISQQFTPDSSISTIDPKDDHFDKLKVTPCSAHSINMGMTAGYQWFLSNGLNTSVGGGYEAINQDNIFNPDCDSNTWKSSRGLVEFRIGFAI